MPGGRLALGTPSLQPGWAARIRSFDEDGPPHYTMISGRMAKCAEFIRRQWHSDVLCGVYRLSGEDLDGSDLIVMQTPQGLPPLCPETIDPWVKQVELCPIELESADQPILPSGNTEGENTGIAQLMLPILSKLA